MGILKDKDLKAIHRNEIIPDKGKLVDGEGLYIKLKPLKSGGMGMYWRLDYQYAGKRKTLPIGTYPQITITEARNTHKAAKVGLTKGIDPMTAKRADKVAEASKTTFKELALDWCELPRNKSQWCESYREKVLRIFSRDVFPVIGQKSVKDVIPSDVIRIMLAMEKRGASTQAALMRQITSGAFKYGMVLEVADRNPADIDPTMILAPRVKKPRAAITDPVEIGKLLRNIDVYNGYIQTKHILRLAPLLMLRPGELRAAEWSEFDFTTATWTIQATRMKSKQHIKAANLEQHWHIVPLPLQAVAILQDLHQYTGRGRYVFPNVRGNAQYLSGHTITAALRNMGYTDGEMCAHGFRGMASTRLNEMRKPDGSRAWDSDVIERQLAHTDKNVVRRAYNRADYLTERREMLQAWADYLDTLRAG
ncbi:tyrosine-type recombinase/integrase [Thiothrix subterranea]|uniref:tyrosine-type recombinase/integrase n=1 Tax=Thiothrix subterranea TaxID=2735563 RepID=UPI00192AE984|nr:site-specific integrase [Thiothrix subterranea]QQZ27618.1 tyrosine-type recombinase/integrase [Thiothrix subterranea]